MKGRSLSILGILSAVAGALLILCCDSIKVSGVTITGGILFVGVGLINLMFYSSISKAENATARVLSLVSNAAAIVLGISMLVFQSTFTPLIAFMFSLFIAVCALWQFFVLAIGARPYQLPAWLYVFPILLTAAAIYLFVTRPVGAHTQAADDRLLMLVTGISLAVLGLGCMIEGSVLGYARRSHAKAAANKPEPAVEDVTSTPVAPSTPESTTNTSTVEPQQALVPKKKVETTEDLDDEIM